MQLNGLIQELTDLQAATGNVEVFIGDMNPDIPT